MSRKRKKPPKPITSGEQQIRWSKRPRHEGLPDKGCEQTLQIPPLFEHPVLSLYFAKLFTLRDYLAQVLASTESGLRLLKRLENANSSKDADLCSLLDSTLIGFSGDVSLSNIEQDIASATQSPPGTHQPAILQSEVVDLVLQILFYRSQSAPKASKLANDFGKPNHILALGYKLHQDHRKSLPGFNPGQLGIQVINVYPNSHVNTIKGPLWSKLLQLIKEEAMLKLLLDTSIFIHLGKDIERKNYYQLCGPPISDAINNPTSVVKTPGTSKHGSLETLGRNRRVGTPLKHPMSEIEQCPTKSRNRHKASLDLPATTANQRTSEFKDLMKASIKQPEKYTPGEILFVRSRIFYSKPVYNARGDVKFGLRHIHVLNRFPRDSHHVLKYIFPRQFNLHNVFTSEVDRKETIQRHKDYTLREQEIAFLKSKMKDKKEIPIPKRLKGRPVDLVGKLQKRHRNCPYHALLRHYCPSALCDPSTRNSRVITDVAGADKCNVTSSAQVSLPSSVDGSKISVGTPHIESSLKKTFTDFACSAGEVSGFVKAVIARVIPNDFFGIGDTNRRLAVRTVDNFVKLRRYESLSLHDALQGLKLTEIDWLSPAFMPAGGKMSKSDGTKRRQLLSEFVYWLFDSFIIPLLQAHFYVTESNVNRNRIYYFRHDVWKKLSEPALNNLKVNTFQELKADRAKRILDHRKLGFSTIRLLPKEHGVRPIINLRKRGMEIKKGRTILTPSINTLMKPVHDVLSFEKVRNPRLMGASMFSITEMYPKLKDFKARLVEKGWQSRKLYFAKVDVQSCFDTIPQPSLILLIKKILGEEEYRIDKYAEVFPPAAYQIPDKHGAIKPMKKFTGQAKPIDDFELFADSVENIAKRLRPGTVLVDNVVSRAFDRDELLGLLENHLGNNLMKIGKKFFRQKTGVPQGSVLSTILCSFFYGELESQKLKFVSEDCILLRMIDDFLLITLDKNKANKFLQTMHDGLPEYGVQVNRDKSLVNFETTINGEKIKRLAGSTEFPYCGCIINTRNLNLRKDRDRKSLANVDDALTVDYSKRPGSALLRKTVHTFKIQSHAMYFDTGYNSIGTVVKNIFHAFVEAAMKFHRYVKSLQCTKRISSQQLKFSISNLFELAYVMLKSREKNAEGRFRFEVTHSQVKWLGAHAFKKVLGKKQSAYSKLLQWLEETKDTERSRGATKRIGFSGLTMGPFKDSRY